MAALPPFIENDAVNLPAFLLAATVLFWGWQGAHWWIAAALVALLEARRVIDIGFKFPMAELKRIVTTCLLSLSALAVFLFVQQGAGPAILQTVQWSPLILAPLALALLYSDTAKVDPQQLFALPGAAALEQTDTSRQVNLGYAYLALWLLAASVANQSGLGFFIGLAVLCGWILWYQRPSGGAPLRWLTMLLVALAVGAGISHGLFRLQQVLEETASGWFDYQGSEDPARTRTSLGHIGSLKLSDAIVLRVTASPLQPLQPPPKLPMLLMTASYNVLNSSAFSSPSWLAAGGNDFSELKPIAGGWDLRPSQSHPTTLNIATTSSRDTALLALPDGINRVESGDLTQLQRNRVGTAQAGLSRRSYRYRVAYDAASADASPSVATDLALPPREAVLLNDLARSLHLREQRPEAALKIVKSYFANNFSYSTFRKGNAFNQSAMEDFLLRNRSGHCEHFASATVLLLRAAGIPARYAVGYSVDERDRFSAAYIARHRDAHAWTRVYINGTWQDFDTTPGGWSGIEADQASLWEPLLDGWSWLLFQIRALNDAGHPLLVYVVGVLALIWSGRKFRRYKGQWKPAWLQRQKNSAAAIAAVLPASAFYQIEETLAAHGWARLHNEPLNDWLARLRPEVGDTVADELAQIAALHTRYRFGPPQPDAQQHAALALACRAWLAHFAAAPLAKMFDSQ